MCGLLKRDWLGDVDIGFAIWKDFGAAYALEAGTSMLEYGWKVLGLKRMVAITAPHNEASIRLLGKLGLQFEGMVLMRARPPRASCFGVAGATDSGLKE